MKDSCISNLLKYSKRYRASGWGTIPVDRNKQPDIPSVVPLRNMLPSDSMLDRYFGINKKPTTVGLAVLIDSGKFMIDTDGVGEEIFITKVVPRLNPELKEKIRHTTHTKSPHGRHFLGKCTGSNNGNGKSKKNEYTWSFVHDINCKGHDEIKIRLYGFYSIECGEGYAEVTAIENAQDFIDVEIEEIVAVTNEVSREINVIRTITDLITPFYIQGNRDEINFSLSGFLHKGRVPEQLILDIIAPLIDKQNAVEPAKTYDVIKRTCNKPADTDRVSGFERFLAAVNNDKHIVSEIQQVLCDLGKGKYFPFSNSNLGSSSNNKERRRQETEESKKKENKEKDDYVNKLISKYNIKTLTDTREIWFYDKDRGIFVENGYIAIEKRIESDYPHISNKQISEYLGHITRRTFTNRSEFDANIEWLACNNCMLNVKTGEIADFNPHFMCTTSIPVRYPIECASGFIADFFRLVEGDKTICPKPKSLNIMRFLHGIMSDKDVEIILDFLAYCLWRDYRYNIWILLNGKGNNGKSTLLKLLIRFLGRQNMSSESLDRLVNNRFAPANLYRKLINVDADLSDKTLKGNTGILKKLTGGDELEAEEKYKKAFSFVNHAKPIFSCNTIPETDDETDAFFRRLIIINFTTQFFKEKEDPALIDKLCTEEEFSGLLLELLERLPRVLKKGLRPTSNEGISDTYEKYVKSSNPVKYFAEKALVKEVNNNISKTDLYEAYKRFCKIAEITIESLESFSRALSKEGYQYKICTIGKGKPRIRYWIDVKLADWLELKNVDKAQQIFDEIIKTGEIEAETEADAVEA
ncbi:MAG: phage/plasmid primase, P4 family [Nitrososphaeraceae archaeon]